MDSGPPLPDDVRQPAWQRAYECCAPWLRHWRLVAVPLTPKRPDVDAVALANAAALRRDGGGVFHACLQVRQRVHGSEARAEVPLNPHNGHLRAAEDRRHTARCAVAYFCAAHASQRVEPASRRVVTYRSETYTLTAPNVAPEVCAVLVRTERELNERGGGALAFDWLTFTTAKLAAVQRDEGRAAALMWRAAYAEAVGAHRVPSFLDVLWHTETTPDV